MIDHPAQAEHEILRLSDLLEQRTGEYGELAEAAAVAEHDHKAAFHRAVLASEAKTVADREAEAFLASEDLHRVRVISDARARACQDALRSVRTQLDALRSINANVRQLAGGGGR